MTDNAYKSSYARAIEDFRRARWQAKMQQILGRLSSKPVDALSYEQVRNALDLKDQRLPQLRDIPLAAITGSVGRYTDFTRTFLPKAGVDEGRWAGVKVATTGLAGLPPIDVYQIGEAYFVLDGNHRVSVARQLGATHIEAYVTELQTPVTVTPDDDLDDVILKAERLAFLAHTRIDQIRPEADLAVTAPGQYPALEQHIWAHQYFLGLDLQRDIGHEEAVASWYDTVYLPVVQVIRDRGILRQFPDRTETDLYLWASRHREALQAQLGWEVEPGLAAADLPSQAGTTVPRTVSQAGKAVWDAVTASEPGKQRKEHAQVRRDDRLFARLLVPLRGDEDGWQALAQAFRVAWREGSQVRALHVVPTEKDVDGDAAQALRAEFDRRCNEAGVAGQLAISAGKVAAQIHARSRWTDLVVIKLDHPPPPQVLRKLGSGFRAILRRCASPVLAVPEHASDLQHPLLAYDGSPKAGEALFVATYLAGRWRLPLTVVTVAKSAAAAEKIHARAAGYLAHHGLDAHFVPAGGPVAAGILETAVSSDCDLVIMGGYGRPPITEVTLGSAVEEVLRTSPIPILICQ
jgi:nucleotide-binding universal stress UspA family protein